MRETPDHYLPLLYVAGMRQPGDDLKVLVEGIDLGSVSMTAYQLGLDHHENGLAFHRQVALSA